MRVTMDRDRLADTAAQVARFLPQTATYPLLAGIRLHAAGGGVEISAFDYEVSCLGRVTAEVDEEGTVIVPGRLLAEIARSLPAGKPAELASDGTRLTLRCGTARFILMQLPGADYPGLPEMPPPAGTIGSDALASAVSQVIIAASKDDTLPALTAVQAAWDGEQLSLTATDRYRLAIAETTWTPARPELKGTALIPARVLADVMRRSAEAAQTTIYMAASDEPDVAGFEAGIWQSTTRLISATFPETRSKVPADFGCAAEVPVAAFTAALKRVALVAAPATPVQITFAKGSARLEAGTGDEAQAREETDVTFDDGEFTIAFNPAYLTDGLLATGADTARISMTTAARPALLTAPGHAAYRYVLVPIRNAG